MRGPSKILAVFVLACLLGAGSTALAQTSNFWTNAVGTVQWSTAGNWDPNTVPTTTNTFVLFTNAASSAYTVQFSGVSTSGPLIVTSDNVTFDVAGYTWRAGGVGYDYGPWSNSSHLIAWDLPAPTGALTATVVFSSSSVTNVPNGNRIDLNPGVYTAFGIGPGATVSVDDSLGFPVTLNAPYNVFVSGGGDLTISGPGVSFTAGTQQGAVSGAGSSVLVANGASLYSTFGGVGGGASFTLDNATKTDGGFIVGNVGSGTMLVTNSSLWNSTGGLTVGYNYGPGNLTIDDSAVSAVSLVVGAPNLVGAGTVTVRNGGTLALSTGSLVVNRPSWPGYGGANYLVLENGTIQMGAGANPGVLTNFSVMRAAGTIRGGGTSPALVYVGSSGTGTGATLEVGSSIGTLTLVNANLELAAGSQTLLQFSDTGLDQIIINGGSASVLGSNVFSLAAGSALPAPGVKWGLGAYNFVVGDSVTWNPQYDDLTNVLASYGLVQNLDYRFGVFNLDGGLQALRLEFVPEPSTVMLLIGGGLVLFRLRRKQSKGETNVMKSAQKLGVALVLLALLSGTSAFAVSTNVWGTNSVGSYSGDYTNAVHWTPGLPATYDQVWFTNEQASAYTVTFTTSITNGPIDVRTDKVNFDLNGNLWRLEPDPSFGGDWYGGNHGRIAQRIANGAGETSTVTFSSSSAGANTVLFTEAYGDAYFGNASGSATVNINTNLGYGVKVWIPDGAFILGFNRATVNVEGPGAVFDMDNNYGWSTYSTLNVTDGGQVLAAPVGANFFMTGGQGGNTVNVSRAGLLVTGTSHLSYLYPGGTWQITDGGIWNGGDVVLAAEGLYPNHSQFPYFADLLIDGSNSVATLKSLKTSSVISYSAGNGQATVQNRATLAVTNFIVVTAQTSSSAYTNRLVLNDATINLGGGAVAGVLTNRGIMKAMGTITGLGASPALVRSEAELEVGGSIGTLTLNNANLELAAGSETLWEFSDTGLDQIILNGGSASVLGSNVFSLAAGSALPAPGVKWGLGAYNFVVGDTVTWNPQYDDLTNVLASYGLVQNLDYRFGVFNLDGGLQALRLEFVPEPSTVLLLVGGGLVLLRFRRRKQSKGERNV